MKKTPLIGRTEEQKILQSALQSPKPEMVAVIGRRRVGKTFLIKSVYQNRIDFEISGVQNASRNEQLRNFMLQIAKFSQGQFPMTMPKDWLEAFYLLSKMLEIKNERDKIIVFLDELPWLATHRSGFLKGLSWFWNSWAADQNIVVVICGSAASWMIRKVIHDKGGLHNRVTKRIYLKPFNLAETESFLQSKNIHLDRYQILHLYMVMGGVPHYLDEIEGGRSTAQNIDAICFSENGLLRDEFSKLYGSLFDNAASHIKVIRALGSKRMGMTRAEIVQHSRLPEGGGLSEIMEELQHSGFIAEYLPFEKKKKDSLFRLTDEFSLFYLYFMENTPAEGNGVWQQFSQTPSYVAWAGYTFESICLKHIQQIKKALGIAGIYTKTASFVKKGSATEEGFQFDLLIDRNDHVINACEIKFYAAAFQMDKTTALQYRNKIARFKELSQTNKQVFLTMITTFGVRPSPQSQGLIDVELTMDDLFAPG